MLRQVFVIKGDDIIYQRIFGNALNRNEVEDLRFKIKSDTMKKSGETVGFFDYYKYRLSYIFERDLDLFFIFISGLTDEPEDLKIELKELRNELLNLFGEVLTNTIDTSLLELLNPIVDKIFILSYIRALENHDCTYALLKEFFNHHDTDRCERG